MANGEGVRGEGGYAWSAWQRDCAWQGDVRAGETATEAGGTHPTGMYSCFLYFVMLCVTSP